ncbi:hypothetical protein ACH4C2_37065 [Streptomyces sp. NPDC018057]|uniref:hypothetical protein n=1 Tax=unclassified Streptomyces TaxID=2593676 RepID=UPI00379AEC8F
MTLTIPTTASGIAGALTSLTAVPWWVVVLLLLPTVLQGMGDFITRVVPTVSQARTAAMRRRHTDRILQGMDDSATALAHLECMQWAAVPGPAPATGSPAAEDQPRNDVPESPP